MEHVTSADGTPIATHTVGVGPAIVIVGGAMSTAIDAEELARAFANAGLQVTTYDRRGRGDSGDRSHDRDRGGSDRGHTSPAEPLREVEDLAAVLAGAGGDAAVFGHSSGAMLAHWAAGLGVPMRHLFLSEPPYRFGADAPAEDLAERIEAMVDGGRPGEAIVAFVREAVGMPGPVVDEFRASPAFETVLPIARSTAFDTRLSQVLPAPSDEMIEAPMPVTVLCGAQAMPLIAAAAARLAEVMPDAEHLEVPESIGHRVDPEATARIVAARLLD